MQAAPKDSKPKAPETPSVTETKPGLPLDVESFSDEQLTALIASSQRFLAERLAKRQADFFTAIREQAEQLGLEPADVAAALAKRRSGPAKASDARSSVQPKYRNPENPAQTWAGRGATPAWIELGPDKKPLPKFRIPDVAA
jgi:DNA-binding protein H-NS